MYRETIYYATMKYTSIYNHKYACIGPATINYSSIRPETKQYVSIGPATKKYTSIRPETK